MFKTKEFGAKTKENGIITTANCKTIRQAREIFEMRIAPAEFPKLRKLWEDNNFRIVEVLPLPKRNPRPVLNIYRTGSA